MAQCGIQGNIVSQSRIADRVIKTSAATRGNAVNFLLLSFGTILNLAAYESPRQIFLAGIFFGFTYAVLWLRKVGGYEERRIFSRIFAVGFVMSGVAAIYAIYLNDPGQLFSDAAGFFEMASGQAEGMSLTELKLIYEGSLAIVLWGAVYDFFAALGFPRERYVGILFNVTAVALTGVLAVKMTREVFGHDHYRFRRLTLLMSSCGMFWLFAGIHLRESVVLLSVTALTYTWLYFLAKPDLGLRLVQVTGFSLVACLFFGYLRAEFVFVPIAMAMAGVAALMVSKQAGRKSVVAYTLVLLGLVVSAVLLFRFGEALQLALTTGRDNYGDHLADHHAADSLGVALIVNQPLPIRLALGSVYLFVFPIPFWSGFQLESAANLFKSFNVIFFYFVIPLLAIAVSRLWRFKRERSTSLVFMLFVSLGFTMAIAASSLETRHFGDFLVPVFILALLPDLRNCNERRTYHHLLIMMLGGVVLVHAAWTALKLN